MLSPVTPNSLLKMHWSPEEHSAPQLSPWAEQHLDVSSTTSPPGGHAHHKHHGDAYAGGGSSSSGAGRRPLPAGSAPSSGYPWASDDISALTASSLLKRYAQKYSGLELMPYGDPRGSSEPAPYLKSEAEPWGGAPGECYPGLEALAGGGAASDTAYSGGSCSSVSPQDSSYPPVYNVGSAYLPAGYCPQPSYSPSSAVYNYPPGCYAPHPQTYSHPSASYLSAPPPPPLGPRPTVVGGSGYGYSSHTSLGGGGGGSHEGGAPLKRKAFEMSEDAGEDGGVLDEDGSRYRKYGNGHKSHGDNGHPGNNGHYDMGSPPGPPADPQQAYESAGKPLMSPPYGGAGDYSPSGRESGAGEQQQHGFPPQQRMSGKMPAAHEDPTGGC